MTEHTIVALYDSLDHANAAQRDLIAAGIPQDRITLTAEARSDETGTATESGGFMATLRSLFVPDTDVNAYAEGVRHGGKLITARVGESDVDRTIDILERHDPIDIDQRYESAHRADYTAEVSTPAAGLTANTQARRSSMTGTGEESVIPVVEEELQVGKREVERGRVRVRRFVVETPVEEQIALRDEEVRVERRSVDRAAGDIGADAFQEQTIELTETDEEAVIGKTARVKEEVVVRKDVGTRTETVRDTVRRTEVEVDDDRAADQRPSRRSASE